MTKILSIWTEADARDDIYEFTCDIEAAGRAGQRIFFDETAKLGPVIVVYDGDDPTPEEIEKEYGE
jgi:hypothetical protein